MKYKYIPDSFNNELISSKFKNDDEFIYSQIIYRKGFEKILNEVIDFNKINQYILSTKIDIPEAYDKEYNFYHKYSNINSKYIFLRNNFHVEKLSTEEIGQLLNKTVDKDFYNNTLEKVIFEDGFETFYGIPMNENKALSKSIVFEFSYNQKKCTDVNQLMEIKKICEEVCNMIETELKQFTQIPISFIIYDCISNEYKNDNDENNYAQIL